ncbi:hypothetical protein L1887_63378 [Cichorium endivia]|nr:hypothetical protein L1887_63378 [Cichorium endivia]
MMVVDGRDASTSVGRADPRLGLCGQANAAATTRKLQGGLLLHEAWRSASGAQTNRQDSLARDEQGILGIACLFKINSGSYRSHSGRRHLPQGTGCGFDRDSFAREKVAGIFANSLRSPSSLPSRCPVRARTLEARDFGSLSNPGSSEALAVSRGAKRYSKADRCIPRSGASSKLRRGGECWLVARLYRAHSGAGPCGSKTGMPAPEMHSDAAKRASSKFGAFDPGWTDRAPPAAEMKFRLQDAEPPQRARDRRKVDARTSPPPGAVAGDRRKVDARTSPPPLAMIVSRWSIAPASRLRGIMAAGMRKAMVIDPIVKGGEQPNSCACRRVVSDPRTRVHERQGGLTGAWTGKDCTGRAGSWSFTCQPRDGIAHARLPAR